MFHPQAPDARSATDQSQIEGHRTRESASRAILTFLSPFLPGSPKGVFPQQPQVSDLIGRENRVLGGQAGIPNETPRAVKMSRLLYEQLELVCPVTTKSGKLSTSEASLVRLQGQHKAYLFSDKECCERSRDSL